MLTYHNDQATKDKYLQRMAAHIAADELRQGDPERCAIGCTLDGLYSHEGMAQELGWPLWLVYWYENIFESLPAENGPEFCMSILAAVPVGVSEAETERWRHAIAVRRLSRLLQTQRPVAVEFAIKKVIAYHADPDRTETMRFEAELVALSAVRSARSVADAMWAVWEPSEASEAVRAAESARLAARSAAASAELAKFSAASAESASMAAAAATWLAREAVEEYRAQWRDFLEVIAYLE